MEGNKDEKKTKEAISKHYDNIKLKHNLTITLVDHLSNIHLQKTNMLLSGSCCADSR